MASALTCESVLSVHHWTETLFSFRTTRDRGLRFESGQFVMLGLEDEGKAILRAYSIASANFEDWLEFFSIKAPGGKLTSKLQNIRVGSPIFIGRKATGTLLFRDLRPGRRLYLLGTGTGLAPFVSIVHDPQVYEAFDQVILAHGVRNTAELAYADYITKKLPFHPLVGEAAQHRLLYYPAVSRESFTTHGRLSTLIESGRLCSDLGLPTLDPAHDRFMLCGSQAMLATFGGILGGMGFGFSAKIGEPGDVLVERAFAAQ